MESRAIESVDGTELCLWEEAPPSASEAVLFVHGATYGARSMFGVAPGVEREPSWFEAVSESGRAAFGIDVRGYGRSERPFSVDGGDATDIVRAPTAAEDVLSAYRAIDDRFDAVHLVGFSWGTLVSGTLLAEHDVTPSSLALVAPVYAPEYDFEAAPSGDRDPELDPFRTVTKADVRERWNQQIPDAPPAALRFGSEESDPVLDRFWDALHGSNQRLDGEPTPTIVAPNGALADVRQVCEDGPIYDASKVDVPTCLVRGALDTTATRSDALALVDELASDGTVYTEIGNATHMVPLETRRRVLFDAVGAFQKNAREGALSAER